MRYSLFLVFFVHMAASASQYDAIVSQFVKELKNSGDLAPMSQCLGISENVLLTKYSQGMSDCFENYADDDQKLEQCFVSSSNDISPKFEACVAQFDDDEDGFGEDDDYQELTPQDLDALVAQAASKFSDSFSQTSGDVSAITLPIFAGSKVQMHFPDGMVFDNVKGLPVATFKAFDSLENIVAFYSKALPGFAMAEDDGTFRFAKQLPDSKLGLMAYLKEFSQMPHISVMEAAGNNGIVLEIAYRK